MWWSALAVVAVLALGMALWARRGRRGIEPGDERLALPALRVQRAVVALRIDPVGAPWLAPWLRTQGAPGALLPDDASAVLTRLGEALGASTHGTLATGRRAAPGVSVRCEGAVMTQVLLVGVVFARPEALALQSFSRAALGAWLERQSAREPGTFTALWVEWTIAEAAQGALELTRWDTPDAPVAAGGATRASG